MNPRDVTVAICTYGDDAWVDLAYSRAFPSTLEQGAGEVIVLHHEEGTLAGVRNQAGRDAQGLWLCFLDADDELEPGYLAAMCERWSQGAILDDWSPLLVPAVRYVEEWSELGGTATAQRISPPKVLNDGRPLADVNRAVIGTLIRRGVFLGLDGFRDLPALEDWDLWLRCERAGLQLIDVPAAVYRVWVREGSRNEDQSLYHQIRAEHFAAGGIA